MCSREPARGERGFRSLDIDIHDAHNHDTRSGNDGVHPVDDVTFDNATADAFDDVTFDNHTADAFDDRADRRGGDR